MSERYTSVFSLPANLYAAGAPVVISAGCLLKDNQTGAILAQLKLRNISPKTIIGVRIRLRLFDTFSSVIGEPVEHEYLDLCAARDAEFGQKQAVFIPEIKARIYKVTVTSVVFEDRSVWTANEERWKALAAPNRLMFHDPELRKQYEIKFGRNFGYEPLTDRDLWYCTCGALNHMGENCHICRNTPQAFNMAELVAQKNSRLAWEAAVRAKEQAAREAAAEAARQRKEAAAAAARQKKEAAAAAVRQKKESAAAAVARKKEDARQKKEAAAIAAAQKKEVAAQKKKEKAEAVAQKKEAAKQKRAKKRKSVLPTVCIAAVLVPLLLYFGIPAAKYCKAFYFMNAGRYEEAVAAFEAMDGYGDSEVRIEICRENIRENTYQDAIALMAQESYLEAFSIFRELGNYKDCQTRISLCESASQEVTYQIALELMESKDFETAREKLRKVPRYRDSLSLIRTCSQELGQVKEAEALKLVEEKQYKKALDAFKAAEAYGIDCNDQIVECEIAILSNPDLKRNARTKPYVTRGKPIGKERKVYGSTEGDVQIYGITRVDLDNGCVRFTVDYTPPKCDFISIFDPPSGSIFMFYEEKKPILERQTLVFDILKTDVQEAHNITFRFGNTGGWIFMRNLY